jgi:hypothetical protein
VGAGARVAQERAYLIRRFGRQDVFEFAGLLLDFGLAVHGEAVCEEALGKAVAADDAAGALTSAGSQFDNHRAIADRGGHRLQSVMAGIHERLVVVGLGRMRGRNYHSQFDHLFDRHADWESAVNFHPLNFGNLTVFFENPEFFQDFVELFFVR